MPCASTRQTNQMAYAVCQHTAKRPRVAYLCIWEGLCRESLSRTHTAQTNARRNNGSRRKVPHGEEKAHGIDSRTAKQRLTAKQRRTANVKTRAHGEDFAHGRLRLGPTVWFRRRWGRR
jgi:hypothetical protein